MENRITSLFGVKYPVVQAGMVWCSGWRLAAAVSEAGGLGLIGAGSMYPEVLRDHIRKCRVATDRPFGVNVPLLYPDVQKLMKIIAEEKVRIVFTSAGNPAVWTGWLKERGIKVAHVVANSKFALKAEASGVDAVVVEGFEAGGHNGREETTTFCLVPMICDLVKLPVIAAGGIGSGRAMAAAMALGAEGVQVGSAFAIAEESSAHERFKAKIIDASEGDTRLSMKKLVPVRLLKNEFSEAIKEAEARGATVDELSRLLGKGKARLGMFEGDTAQGELEIGQVSAMLNRIRPAGSILKEMIDEFNGVSEKLKRLYF